MTDEQIEQQSFVDYGIMDFIRYLTGKKELDWDIELIGNIRDAIQKELLEKGIIDNEFEFYPYDKL